jgi:DNA-binding CsgD family transcriptional regulator
MKSLRRLRLSSEAISYGLTVREFQVLVGMARGMTYQEMHDELILSLHTIKSHAKSLFSKLGVSDRAMAVSAGFRLGILRRHQFPEVTDSTPSLVREEVEMLVQFAKARSAADIHRRLGLTTKPGISRVDALLKKMGTPERSGAVCQGFCLGYLLWHEGKLLMHVP